MRGLWDCLKCSDRKPSVRMLYSGCMSTHGNIQYIETSDIIGAVVVVQLPSTRRRGADLFPHRLRRMKQQQESKKAREALLEKVAARSFAKNYLSTLKTDVSSQLNLLLISTNVLLTKMFRFSVYTLRSIIA